MRTKANVEGPTVLPSGLLNTLLRQMCREVQPAQLGGVGSCSKRPTENTLKLALVSAS